MILSNSGTNELIIGTDSYYTLSTGNTIVIESDDTHESKSIYLLPTSNDRYTYWNFTIVTGSTQEDLSNGIIYLQRGFYNIKIYNDDNIIYNDILFVDIDINNTIYGIDDDDEIIYSIPD